MAVTQSWALSGIPNFVFTFDHLYEVRIHDRIYLNIRVRTHVLEKGRAPSLENAQNILPVLNWEPTIHGPNAIHSMKVNAKAPPTVVVACRNNSASGKPVDVDANAE